MTPEQERKLDQIIEFQVALSGEINDLTNLLRNYISGQSSLEERVARIERRSTTPCPPPANGEAA